MMFKHILTVNKCILTDAFLERSILYKIYVLFSFSIIFVEPYLLIA